MSLINTLFEFAPVTAGLCGAMLLRELQLRCRAEKKLREERANRRRAMDQAGAAVGDAYDAREDARTLRRQLNARNCSRCGSPRVARFCGNCGADQLPPGTPLAKGPDGKCRPLSDGEVAEAIVIACRPR